jgi:hypothetical protein
MVDGEVAESEPEPLLGEEWTKNLFLFLFEILPVGLGRARILSASLP